MTPTRRVLLAIGLLALTLLVLLLTSWHLQTNKLGDALVADIEATQARIITRDPPLASPLHDNGYACFAELEDVTPKDLGPFEGKNSKTFGEVMDGGVVPADWEPKLASLAPWAESLRGCGDSAQLKFVSGVSPFTTAAEPWGERGTQVLLALGRMTRLQARLLAAEGNWEQIAEHCAGTLEVALDRSHLNLIGAMVASGAVRAQLPSCAEALQRLSPESRPALAARFGRLPKRLAPNHEYLEAERLLMSLNAYRWLLSDAQKEKAPAADYPFQASVENPLMGFASVRMWPRWDRGMRQLAAASDVPGPGRMAASRALAEGPWWLPAFIGAGSDYEKFLRRTEDTRVLLQLLADLASGETKPLPAQVTRVAAGLEFTDFNGEKLLIPTP